MFLFYLDIYPEVGIAGSYSSLYPRSVSIFITVALNFFSSILFISVSLGFFFLFLFET